MCGTLRTSHPRRVSHQALKFSADPDQNNFNSKLRLERLRAWVFY